MFFDHNKRTDSEKIDMFFYVCHYIPDLRRTVCKIVMKAGYLNHNNKSAEGTGTIFL